jgi:hypothetical protein
MALILGIIIVSALVWLFSDKGRFKLNLRKTVLFFSWLFVSCIALMYGLDARDKGNHDGVTLAIGAVFVALIVVRAVWPREPVDPRTRAEPTA